MPATALYLWNVADCPVSILLDLPLADRFRVAATTSTTEIGGVLLGHFDGKYTVVLDFEAVECEHRRGPAFTLSQRDEQRLRARLDRGKQELEVVGFFRSHLRPGLFLDERDFEIVSSYFSRANQVVLLVRPAPDRSATGGFFFWENGEMNRKQSYLPFPMNSSDLEMGDFPLVEPVAAAKTANDEEVAGEEILPIALETEESSAEVVSQPAAAGPVASASTPRLTRAAAPETGSPLVPASAENRRAGLNWPVIGIIAVGAALGGYLIGTSGGSHDQFGARPGDITLNSEPEAKPPQPAPISPSQRPSAAPTGGVTVPAPSLSAQKNATAGQDDRPSAMPPPKLPATESIKPSVGASIPTAPAPTTLPARPQSPTSAVLSAPVPTTATTSAVNPPAQTQTPVTPMQTAPPQATSAPSATDTTDPGWKHFQPQPEPKKDAFVARPAPVPPRGAPFSGPSAESSVYLESVQSGSMRRAIGRIPLFGKLGGSRSGGEEFTAPQAVVSFAPKVPPGLARELTSTLPVDLKLTVDRDGRVSSVELLSHQTPTEFIRLAGDAAYDWKFEPARVKDKAVPSNVIAHFRFRPAL